MNIKNFLRTALCTVLAVLFAATAFAKKENIIRVEPPSWWTGMKTPLQLMVYAADIGNATVKSESDKLKINSVHKAESENYLFIDISIDQSTPEGKYRLTFTGKNGKARHCDYQINARRGNSAERKGFSTADVIYCLVPDRFANGDPSNDNAATLGSVKIAEKADRRDPAMRHGGDIQGITNNLNYIKELGATVIWPTPLTLDNEKAASYHGYACADYYAIDPRFGTNELYRSMVKEAHEKGLKVIMDMVPNHCGTAHWWMNDLPFSDWVNMFPSFTRSTFQVVAQSDPHNSQYDKDACLNGWFDYTMPDMNLRNKFVVQYLLQMAVWWIEYADLDGLRVDTYPYSDKYGISIWTKGITDEYPNINITGETWFHFTSLISYWEKDAANRDGYNSYLPCPMDFPLQENLLLGIMEDGKTVWGKGLIRIYEVLSQDFIYKNPYDFLILAENHDVRRLAWQLKGSVEKQKMIYTLLATMRGIPQIYQGSELFMQNKEKQGDIHERLDMVGGWKEDTRNAFTEKGRTELENDLFNYIKNIYSWRSTSDAVHNGKMIQFVPEDNNFYVYFRYTGKECVMTVINNLTEQRDIDWAKYAEVLDMFPASTGKDIVSGKTVTKGQVFSVGGQSAAV
ncbi:MAG: glycoside hydrolase family 13 protein, partial [Bacteroidales bacterium]|nr:glycoside hydrolase family 13 protein [Bacteroidales bacterium]